MAMIADARQKPGIWTQHVDAATGRTFYFNLVHNRSYWELPPEQLAHVRKPVIETLREWDPEAAARYEQPTSSDEAQAQQRKKREEVLQAAALAAASEGTTASTVAATALQERMAIAAAQKRADEMKRYGMAAEQKTKEETGDENGSDNNEYLSMVRELQANDRDTEATGSKWLVR